MIERWKFERDLRFLDIGMDESLLDALYKYIQEMIFNEIEEAKITACWDSEISDLEYENELLQSDIESSEEKIDDLPVQWSLLFL